MTLTPEQTTEIEAARASTSPTLRPTVPALEAMLFTAIPVLDHGFIRVVDYMGDDSAVVQAARVSYGRGTRKALEDEGLIRYLMRHYHSTPFETVSYTHLRRITRRRWCSSQHSARWTTG